MPAFPEARLRQAGLSAARVAQLRADYDASTPARQQTLRGVFASATSETLRAVYDPTGVPESAGVTPEQLAATHDTDPEREQFVPARLSDAALRATSVAAGQGVFAPVGVGLSPARVRNKRTPGKVITTFQAGHGFTVGNADATSNINDTANFDLGSQSATLITKGDGSVSTLGNGAVTTAVNLGTHNLRLRFRGTNLAKIARFEVYGGTAGLTNRYQWGAGSGPVGLYRQEVNYAVNYSKDGEWVDLDLSLADATVSGTPDRTTINAWQLRLADDATGKVTVNYQGLYAVPKSPTYPTGVVSWTWDDSVLSPLELAKPRLDRYGFLSTFYVILDVLGTPGYFSLAQARALYSQGNDIAPHCTTLARHSSPNGMVDLTADQLEQEFRDLKAWQYAQGFTRSADHFATPQGKFTPAMVDAMRRYFASHRSTVYFSRETLRPGSTMRLRCIPLPGLGSAMTVAQCTAAIDAAYAEGAWVIFMGHKVVAGASTSPLECTQADFHTVCDYVATKGIPVDPVSLVLDSML